MDDAFLAAQKAYREDPTDRQAQRKFAGALAKQGLFGIYETDEGYMLLNVPLRHFVSGIGTRK